jgi:hypothetical protein
MRRTKLDDTGNFIKLYRHMVGKSEVPQQFHLWTCLSLLAACAGERYWIEKFRGSKLYPNLYVVLLGPSGCGKGVAIDLATRLVQDNPEVNTYRGKTTGQYLIQHLGTRTKTSDGRQLLENARMYLLTPELAMSVGSGTLADDFIKIVTELYTGGDYLFQYGTRTHDNVTMRGHVINWLGGSTKEWFIQALTRDAVEGGALARMVLIPAKYDCAVRYPEPILPHDHEFIKQHLEARVMMIIHGDGGLFVKTDEARLIEEQWYHSRDVPGDDVLMPTWRRQHDLMLKLAMLLSLADGGDLVIRKSHMAAAKQMSHAAQVAVPSIITLASLPPEHAGYQFVRDFIKKAGKVQRQTLTTRCAKRGIMAARLDEFLKMLLGEHVITKKKGSHGSTWYIWQGRGKILREVPEDDDGDESE